MSGSQTRKFVRGLRRMTRRFWDTPLACAGFWFCACILMLLFALLSPLCVSTRPCAVAQLAQRLAMAATKDSEVAHDEVVGIKCVDPTLVPSHPQMKCNDGTFQGLHTFECTTTQEARLKAEQKVLAASQAQALNSACQISAIEAKSCPFQQVKITIPNASREYCVAYWKQCMRSYPLLSSAEHDAEKFECKIFCRPEDPYKKCPTLVEILCQESSDCRWMSDTQTCEGLNEKPVDSSVPAGGFRSQESALEKQQALSQNCFLEGPRCLELLGSCIPEENGEYIRQDECIYGRTFWKQRGDARFISWDPIATQDAFLCSQAGRWIIMLSSPPVGKTSTCHAIARQRSFSTIPEYHTLPTGPDYRSVDELARFAVSEKERLQWRHRNCAESDGKDVPADLLAFGGLHYIRVEDCTCTRRFCSGRGTAVKNEDYPHKSNVRCFCTCDEQIYSGERCEKIRCTARTKQIANPARNGVCKGKEYFDPGEVCEPQCADRFAPTAPGPFLCLESGSWDEAGEAFDCVMTYHECSVEAEIKVVDADVIPCEEGRFVKELEFCTPKCTLGFEPYPPDPIQCTRDGFRSKFQCLRPCNPPFVSNSGEGGSCQNRRRIVSGLKCRPNCLPGTYAMPPGDLNCQESGNFDSSFSCLVGDPPPGWAMDTTPLDGSVDGSMKVGSYVDPDSSPKHFVQIQPSPDVDTPLNGTCLRGLTNYPKCDRPNRCTVLTADANAAVPPCSEGNTVQYQCTPMCAKGYIPDVPVLTCIDNVLYPPEFGCQERFADTCTVLAYVSLAIGAFWVLVLFCILCLKREKAISRHYDVKSEMNNFNTYESSSKYAMEKTAPEDDNASEISESTGLPRKKKKKKPKRKITGLPAIDEDTPQKELDEDAGGSQNELDGFELVENNFGQKTLKKSIMNMPVATSGKDKIIIDNADPTHFFVPDSQKDEYLRRKAEQDILFGVDGMPHKQHDFADTPSVVSYASYDPQEGLMSPQGYPLQRWRTHKPGYECDGCEEVKPAGTVLFSSREESYDMCQDCVLRMVHGYGTKRDLKLQEEDRLANFQSEPAKLTPHERALRQAPKEKQDPGARTGY